jgi:diguanylate cyclase
MQGSGRVNPVGGVDMSRIKDCLAAFRQRLRRTPDHRDVAEILSHTPLGAAASVFIAMIVVANSWPDAGGAGLCGWLAGVISLSAFVALRSRRAARRDPLRVSRRATRRLALFGMLMASPWTVLLLAYFPSGTPQVRIMIIAACCGCMTGSSFMLFRVIQSCFAYYITIVVPIIVVSVMSGFGEFWALAMFTIVFGGYLSMSACKTGEIARERDDSHEELLRSFKTLEHANAAITRLAYVDSITGLPNRKAFTDRLNAMIDAFDETQQGFAVLMMDLDRFKNINDTLGHHVGDSLLALVARRFAGEIGSNDMLARLGGDEFAIIVRDRQTEREISELAVRILRSLMEPALLDNRQIFPGTSVGASRFPLDGTRAGDLLSKADIALNRAKESGRGRFVLFDSSLRAQVERQDWLERELRVALARGEICLAYQPKVHLPTGAFAGAEALLRWRHPDRGEIRPHEFLPIAVERGLLPLVTQVVMDNFARDCLTWQAKDLHMEKLAINLHPLDLRAPDELLARLKILQAQGIAPKDVVLELTETAFVGRGSDSAPLIVDAIADMGFELSLDDFGIGHSSLTLLRKLPISEIKLDRSFIVGLAASLADQAIVSAMAEIARVMGMRLVAEGVESEEQLMVLREIGVDHGQGLLWSGPVSAARLGELFGQKVSETVPIATVPLTSRVVRGSANIVRTGGRFLSPGR